ncbi:hypothetical protein [Flavobacterium sp. LS1R10]|uniref:hypothetical protein n=1 Tax=Flavobacterium sp. LS1R10 TaxID=2497482 RepID=UPI000F84C84C|nr:hypothetical protein [Flavobacterium sp. LS1R10]RTY76709.1 hypothetical protein EKL96_04270 [Flavobacterium sp. LS1R10]
MKFYTQEDAEFLIQFFTNILVGTSIEPPNEILITGLEWELYEGNNYRVICRVNHYQGVTIIDDVAHVAELQGIVSPEEVLANK